MGFSKIVQSFKSQVPERWLTDSLNKLDKEELEKLEKLDFKTLLEKLRERLEEQDSAHSGGNKWIGTTALLVWNNGMNLPV